MSNSVVAGFVLLFAAAIFAVAARREAGRWRRRAALPFLAWAVTGAVLGAAALANLEPAPAPQPPDVPREFADDEYRSSGACRSCHPDQYATWYATYHRTMTQVASPDSVIGDFDGSERTFGGERFKLTEADGEYFGVMNSPAGRDKNGLMPRIIVPLKQTTGSHHMQLYWYPVGLSRMLDIFPVVFLREQQRWIPRGSAFLRPPGIKPQTAGMWNRVCIECHSTHPRPNLGADGTGEMDSHVTELGIACESCHGPGQEHIDANHSPLRRYRLHFSGDPDPTIVNPRELPHVRSSQVCGQCHGVKGLQSLAQFEAWKQEGSSFRPGDDLDESVTIVSNSTLATPAVQWILRSHPDFLQSSFWPDGIVRVAGREYNALLESPCFQRGEMACTSCHTMHQTRDDPRDLAEWRDDMLAPGMRTNEACTQCHEGFQEESVVADHTHHAPGSSGSECQNCHMPHTTYGLLKSIRSHQVDTPSLTAEFANGRPNACNLCHLDRPRGWVATALADWYGTPSPRLSEEDQRIAAGVRWALEGDAGVRALSAWSMGWEPAQAAAGTAWMFPYLAELLDDPYDVVRLIAYRSLKTVPGFEGAAFDEFAAPESRSRAIDALRKQWHGQPAPSVLIDANGQVDRDEIQRLLEYRDNRPLTLLE